MKKYIMPFVICILVGFLLGYFMINQYEDKQNLKLVLGKSETVYFFQYGVYSSLESMEQNVKNLTYYTYEKKDNLYYVYIGMIKDNNNLEKVKGYFTKKGYNIYVKEMSITNEALLNALAEYDLVISGLEKEEAIASVLNQILKKYEVIMNEHKD